MKDNLRSQLIKLAHQKPEMRSSLLPLLRTAGSFEESVKGKKFKNPETGNDVVFGSLPQAEQRKLRSQWGQHNPGESLGKGSENWESAYESYEDTPTDNQTVLQKRLSFADSLERIQEYLDPEYKATATAIKKLVALKKQKKPITEKDMDAFVKVVASDATKNGSSGTFNRMLHWMKNTKVHPKFDEGKYIGLTK